MAQFDRQTYVVRRADISLSSQVFDVVLNLAHQASYTIEVYAPANSICRTQVAYINMPKPVGGASGTHYISIQTANSILTCTASFANNLRYYCSEWDTTQAPVLMPNNNTLMGELMRNIVFDSVMPLKFRYKNECVVAQTGTFSVACVYEKQVI